MPTRESAPLGAPCWTDLWTSDVEGSRKFYSDLFGWEAQEPSPEFGGYFSGGCCGVCTMYTILAPGSPMPPRGWFCRPRESGQFRRRCPAFREKHVSRLGRKVTPRRGACDAATCTMQPGPRLHVGRLVWQRLRPP